MDNRLWRWWAELERVVGSLGEVHLETDARTWPSTEARHLHPNPTMIIALDGLVPIGLGDGRQLVLRPGDVALLGTGVWHEHDYTPRSGAWFGQGFTPTWSDLTLPMRENVQGTGKLHPHPTRALADAAFAAAPARRRDATAAWLRQLVQERIEVRYPDDQALLAMVQLMWRRAHVRITPEELVEASGAARARAYRLFTQWYEMTPKAFILANRLNLAAALLAQGLPVADVAWRSGWSNATTFARCWRRDRGGRPSLAR